jgi:hypothetical protein
VSYDLTFAIVRPGQTLVEAVDALGEQAHHTHELDPAVWDRVLISAREVLGKVDEFASANHRELTHEPTGLQVTYSGVEVGITVPYHFTGAAAAAVLTLAYHVGLLIEERTDFSGYDDQVSLPLAEAALEIDRGSAVFDLVAARFEKEFGSGPAPSQP